MRNDFESNYLMHHGILGQKWGVRRYQNPDGSLTPAGRERYGVKEGEGTGHISTAKGYNKRIKDLNKAIKINKKKRGKEHTKIANNPENFLGMNKKHANKIAEYSENIKKGEEELEKLFAKAESEGYKVSFGKVKEQKYDKWADEEVQPSSVRASIAAGKYAANPTEKNRAKLDALNEKDAERWKKAKEEKAKLKDKPSSSTPKAEVNDKQISTNKSKISKDVAIGMAADLKRWHKSGDSKMPSQLQGKTDAEIVKLIQSKIEKQISNYNKDSVYEYKDGTIDFVIDGIDEYSGAAPITVEYNPRTKKVDFHYT